MNSADPESTEPQPSRQQDSDPASTAPEHDAASKAGSDQVRSEDGERTASTEGDASALDDDARKPGDLQSEPNADPEDREQRLRKHREKHRNPLPESWRVQLPVFEGPLDLLLHLIRINEVEITDIPVALICDQYHEYLDLMEMLDLDIAGEYIYEAAVLIQLKSRLLLPQPKIEEGEEDPGDPREELVLRLLEYQRIKEAAQTLAEVSSVRSGLWIREKNRHDTAAAQAEGDLDVGDLSLFDLLKVFRTVLNRYDREHPPEIVLRGESFSVRDQVERLLSRLSTSKPIDLADDLLALSCRAEAIAAFLAILEMGKMQLIRLHVNDDKNVLIFRTTRELVESELENVLQ